MRRSSAWIWVGWSLTLVVLGAPEPLKLKPFRRFTLPPSALDLSRSVAQPGAVGLVHSNIENIEILDWRAGAAPTNHTAEFLIQLSQPWPVGTIVFYGAGGVEYARSNVWHTALPLPDGSRQARLHFLDLPAGQIVDQVRVRVPAEKLSRTSVGDEVAFQATLPFLTLLPVRVKNVVSGAQVVFQGATSATPVAASLEETTRFFDGVIDPRRNVVLPEWLGRPAPQHPVRIILSWAKPKVFRGVALFRGSEDPDVGDVSFEVFQGEGDPLDPRASAAWTNFVGRISNPGAFRANRFFVGKSSVTSRGLRITCNGRVSRVGLGEIVVLQDQAYASGTMDAKKLLNVAAPARQ